MRHVADSLTQTTPESTHTPLLHSTCAKSPNRPAVAGSAADVAGWRGRRVATGPRCLRRKSAGGRQLDISPAARHDTQRIDPRGANGAARWRATGDVPTPDGCVAGRPRPTRCARQRCRPVGRLARFRLLGGDATCHLRSRAASADRHRPRMVGRPLAAATRRSRRARRRARRESASRRGRRQPGLHCRGTDSRDHRLVRRSNGSTAVGRRRLARAGHRHTSASRRTQRGRPPAPSAHRPASFAQTQSSARPSTIWRASSIKPSAAPRASRSCGHASGWHCPTNHRATGRCR